MTNTLHLLTTALEYGFMQRAMVAGSFIGMCCAVLGVFLVLRRLSLIGEGLAHFSLAPIGLGLLLGIYPLYVALPLAVLASFGILHLARHANMYGDAAIGLVSALGVALGVTLASMGPGFNVDLFSYLFGDILAVSRAEAVASVILSLLVLGLVSLHLPELFTMTFDEEYAEVLGINTARVNHVLVFLTSCTVILGIRVVGTMLVSSLIIFPAVTALQVCRCFRTAIYIAMLTALLSVVLGILLAFLVNIPAGAAIVMVNFFFFALAYLKKVIRGEAGA
ncbi:MAG: metal ABC transporter permease [Thermodesulfobacteriota bacterium]